MEYYLKALSIDKISWYNKCLTIYFTDGKVTEFYGVSEHHYNNLIESEVPFSYYIRTIKGKYNGTKVNLSAEQRIHDMQYFITTTGGCVFREFGEEGLYKDGSEKFSKEKGE